VRARAAADPVLEFGGDIHLLGCFVFSFLWMVFIFHQAAIFCLAAVSALIPIAQMKPNSSRPSMECLPGLERTMVRHSLGRAYSAFEALARMDEDGDHSRTHSASATSAERTS